MIKKRFFLLFTVFVFCFVMPVNAKKKKNALAEEEQTQAQNTNITQWLTDEGRLLLFPSDQYISACTYGSTPEEAKIRAATAVSEFVKSTVKSSVEARMTKSEKNGFVTGNKSITENISVNSQNTLYQLEYTTPFFYEKAVVFACTAYINRDNAFEVLKERLDRGVEFFPAAYEKALLNEDAFTKLVDIYKAQKLMENFYEVYDFVCAVNPEKAKNYSQYDELYMHSLVKVQELKKETLIFVQVENDNADCVKNSLMSALEKNGFSVVKTQGEKYFLEAKVSAEIQKADEVFVSYPSLSVEVFCDKKNVFTYSQTYGKAAGFDENGARRKSYNLICKNIEEKLFE